MGDSSEITISVNEIDFYYGKKKILSDISFFAKRGECIGIIGSNGSGKTTLLNVLAGIKKGAKGSIIYYDEQIFPRNRKGDFMELVGYVPQFDFLTIELSVWDNLLLWYLDKELLERELKQGLLKKFDLWEIRKKRVDRLSGGMRKKVSIACALAKNPEVIILDEPSASLDLVAKDDMWNDIKEWKKAGKNILISTHEEDEIALCDKIYILQNSTLLEMSGEVSKETITRYLKENGNGKRK